MKNTVKKLVVAVIFVFSISLLLTDVAYARTKKLKGNTVYTTLKKIKGTKKLSSIFCNNENIVCSTKNLKGRSNLLFFFTVFSYICYNRKEKRMKRNVPIPFLLIIMGLIESYVYILYYFVLNKGGMNMDTGTIIGSAVAIVIALVGAASGIWAQFVLFKKDSGTMNSIKSDTSEMKPTVNNIDENVKKVRDEVVEAIVPKMTKLEGIDLLVEDYKYREKIRLEKSVNYNKDVLKESIEVIFEENAKLTKALKEKEELNEYLVVENQRLKEKVKSYERRYDRDRGLEL